MGKESKKGRKRKRIGDKKDDVLANSGSDYPLVEELFEVEDKPQTWLANAGTTNIGAEAQELVRNVRGLSKWATAPHASGLPLRGSSQLVSRRIKTSDPVSQGDVGAVTSLSKRKAAEEAVFNEEERPLKMPKLDSAFTVPSSPLLPPVVLEATTSLPIAKTDGPRAASSSSDHTGRGMTSNPSQSVVTGFNLPPIPSAEDLLAKFGISLDGLNPDSKSVDAVGVDKVKKYEPLKVHLTGNVAARVEEQKEDNDQVMRRAVQSQTNAGEGNQTVEWRGQDAEDGDVTMGDDEAMQTEIVEDGGDAMDVDDERNKVVEDDRDVMGIEGEKGIDVDAMDVDGNEIDIDDDEMDVDDNKTDLHNEGMIRQSVLTDDELAEESDDKGGDDEEQITDTSKSHRKSVKGTFKSASRVKNPSRELDKEIGLANNVAGRPASKHSHKSLSIEITFSAGKKLGQQSFLVLYLFLEPCNLINHHFSLRARDAIAHRIVEGQPFLGKLRNETWTSFISRLEEDNEVAADILADMEWSICGHRGASSFTHMDAGGAATVVRSLTGVKHWTVGCTSLDPSLAHRFEAADVGICSTWDSSLLKDNTMFVMPPGMFYNMLTLEANISCGAHFYHSAVLTGSFTAFIIWKITEVCETVPRQMRPQVWIHMKRPIAP
ncbi:hypothetical protein PENSPDRAFT_672249 [Peniophora sp. CONT]|nr:hypothetical protein PENSPDRAFT_672249 [Peniophora sp. CONT]